MNKVLLYLTKGKKSLKEDQMQVMDSRLAVREEWEEEHVSSLPTFSKAVQCKAILFSWVHTPENQMHFNYQH